MLTLAELQIGFEAEIIEIIAEGAHRRRLLEMGLLKHTRIKRIGTAPMGDPMAFSLRGYQISLRRDEANAIVISGSGDQL